MTTAGPGGIDPALGTRIAPCVCPVCEQWISTYRAKSGVRRFYTHYPDGRTPCLGSRKETP